MNSLSSTQYLVRAGPPINGALLSSKFTWWRPALFSGVRSALVRSQVYKLRRLHIGHGFRTFLTFRCNAVCGAAQGCGKKEVRGRGYFKGWRNIGIENTLVDFLLCSDAGATQSMDG